MKKKSRSKGKASRDADVKEFKRLIKKADPTEFERLARVELEGTNKLVKVSMRNSLDSLSREDPEGYEIYQRKGLPGLIEHFVARGTMTKDEYDAWKRKHRDDVEEFNRVMKLYLDELAHNPAFREQDMKKFK